MGAHISQWDYLACVMIPRGCPEEVEVDARSRSLVTLHDGIPKVTFRPPAMGTIRRRVLSPCLLKPTATCQRVSSVAPLRADLRSQKTECTASELSPAYPPTIVRETSGPDGRKGGAQLAGTSQGPSVHNDLWAVSTLQLDVLEITKTPQNPRSKHSHTWLVAFAELYQ